RRFRQHQSAYRTPVPPVPEILGLLRSLRTELKTIFLFSNKVVEVPFRTLLAGHIQTTDGYASMTEENQGKRGLYQAKRGTSGDGTVPAFPKSPRVQGIDRPLRRSDRQSGVRGHWRRHAVAGCDGVRANGS
ncbi:MAG: hypothetical protein R6V12_19945, partial [Candidatus Hydrogenedentota bacterium]